MHPLLRDVRMLLVFPVLDLQCFLFSVGCSQFHLLNSLKEKTNINLLFSFDLHDLALYQWTSKIQEHAHFNVIHRILLWWISRQVVRFWRRRVNTYNFCFWRCLGQEHAHFNVIHRILLWWISRQVVRCWRRINTYNFCFWRCLGLAEFVCSKAQVLHQPCLLTQPNVVELWELCT